MKAKPLKWVKCRKGWRGEELIWKGQYFWSFWINGNHHLAWGRDDWEGTIGCYEYRCPFCGLGFEDAVRRFKPTRKSRTIYSDWRPCALGHCRRLTVKINGRMYWASYSSVLGRVLIFNSHRKGEQIGSLPKSVIPMRLRELSRDA